MTLTRLHNYRIGDFVRSDFRGSPLYGVVIFSGPKRVGIHWETGKRQSWQRNRWHLVRPVCQSDASEMDDARYALRGVLP